MHVMSSQIGIFAIVLSYTLTVKERHLGTVLGYCVDYFWYVV